MWLTDAELLERWHDVDGAGFRYERFGVVVAREVDDVDEEGAVAPV